MAISTNGAIITRLAGALYNEYLSNATYTEVMKDTPAAFVAGALTNDFAGKTNLQIASTILTNVGLMDSKGVPAVAGLDSWLSAQITTNGATTASKAAYIVSALNSFANMTADTTYGAAATAFNTKVSAALVLEQTTGQAAGTFGEVGSASALAQSIPLTTDVDNITGGAGDDTIRGVSDVAGGLSNSFDAGDVIDGGAGIDKLVLSFVGAATLNAATITSPVINSVETLSFTNNTSADDVTTFDVTNMADLTTVIQTGSLDSRGMVVSGIQKMTAAEQAGSGALTLVYDPILVVGTADTQALTLNGTTKGLTPNNTFTVDSVETLTVNTAKASAIVVAGNNIKTITATGAVTLDITVNQDKIKTFDASAATGAVTLRATNINAQATVKTGTGNDIISLTEAISKDISVDGGVGNDILRVTNTAFTTTDLANVKNVETIQLAGSAATSVDLNNAVGLTSVNSALQSTTVTAAETADTYSAAVIAATSTTTFTDANKAAQILLMDAVSTDDAAAALAGDAAEAALLSTLAGATNDQLAAANVAGYRAFHTNAAGVINAAFAAPAFEALNLAPDSTVTLSSVNLSAKYATDPEKFDLAGQGAVNLTVKGASLVTSLEDALTVNIVNDSAVYKIKNTSSLASKSANNNYNIDSITAAAIEKVTINSTGTFAPNKISDLQASSANSIKITGDQALTISNINVSDTDSVVFDASAMTGKLSVSVSPAEVAHFENGLVGGAGTSDSLTIGSKVSSSAVAAGAIDPSNDADITTENVVVKASGFETVSAKFAANATGSFDFTQTGAAKFSITLASGTDSTADTATVTGLADGATLSLGGTHSGSTSYTGAVADKLSIQGAGSNSSLKLVVSADNTAFVNGLLTLTRVGNLTIDTTRVDGSDDDTLAVQAATTIGGITDTTLKTLTVVGPTDATTLSLGQLSTGGAASTLTKVDLSGYAGNLAAAGLLLDNTAGAKGVTVLLNKTTKVGTPAGVLALGDGADLLTVAGDDLVLSAASVAAAGITLGGGSDTVVFGDALALADSAVIANFTAASGATIGTAVDKLNLSALRVTLADLTFTYFENATDTTGSDQAVDSVQIGFAARTGITGTIELIGGITTTNLTADNFIFG
jgi:hypothetical protein